MGFSRNEEGMLVRGGQDDNDESDEDDEGNEGQEAMNVDEEESEEEQEEETFRREMRQKKRQEKAEEGQSSEIATSRIHVLKVKENLYFIGKPTVRKFLSVKNRSPYRKLDVLF
ncbi:hypothetical protein M9H77_31937 [Catharanthus roseus]|uniref:Uncharacterized protein n=1 Tax=Catharanthus roseus TaxID=4058 RepID=A0ACC0A2I6_CATRO|nr:hypothetical protein M9H77_31937 [Catharanthus roseus]